MHIITIVFFSFPNNQDAKTILKKIKDIHCKMPRRGTLLSNTNQGHFLECIKQELVFRISLGPLDEVMFVFGNIWRVKNHTKQEVRLGKNPTGENIDWEF